MKLTNTSCNSELSVDDGFTTSATSDEARPNIHYSECNATEKMKKRFEARDSSAVAVALMINQLSAGVSAELAMALSDHFAVLSKSEDEALDNGGRPARCKK